ncbi:MAG: uracil phosphoribosyltransferase, partial [Planctomycetes bacterium]|nr:uracil phosphoribosyltransferase [Planctomycetota bacterium]
MPQAFVSHHPAILHKLTRLRDQDTPTDEFRELVRQLSMLLGVEATQDIATDSWVVQTPVAECVGTRLRETVALVPILRAGLGMCDGLSELFPGAPVRHLGFYRDEVELVPVPYYNKLPEGQVEDLCLVLDPMLATGGSAKATIDALKTWGARRIKFLGLLAAPEGVCALNEAHPDVPVHLCGLDDRLDE